MVGPAGHAALGRVDAGLWMPLDPALVASVLGRVDRDQPRHAGATRDFLGCIGHQPIVRMHEVKGEPLSELRRRGGHVAVHLLDPLQEPLDVARKRRLRDAVHADPVARLLSRQLAAATSQHVDLHARCHESFGQFAHVAAEPAFDHGRVLPRQHQHTHRR